jgi:hypothetical protein
MLPTLNGRIQTRIFALLVFGGIWTLILTPLLPIDAGLGSAYKTTFILLLTVTVLGVGWEIIYHLLQQFRWEKDWPTLFGLLTAINEGILVWILNTNGWLPGDVKADGASFCIDFITVWLIVWLITNGPMRVPFIRWRFNGGRLV